MENSRKNNGKCTEKTYVEREEGKHTKKKRENGKLKKKKRMENAEKTEDVCTKRMKEAKKLG